MSTYVLGELNRRSPPVVRQRQLIIHRPAAAGWLAAVILWPQVGVFFLHIFPPVVEDCVVREHVLLCYSEEGSIQILRDLEPLVPVRFWRGGSNRPLRRGG